MKDSLTFDGKEFISVRRASEITKYSKDYVGQLCRRNKVVARIVGRGWFVEREGILRHMQQASVTRHMNGYNSAYAAQKALQGSPSPTKDTAASVAAAFPLEWTISYQDDKRPFLPALNKEYSVGDAQNKAGASFKAVHNAFNDLISKRALTGLIAVAIIVSISWLGASYVPYGRAPGLAVGNERASVYDAVESVLSFFERSYGGLLAFIGYGGSPSPSMNAVVGTENASPPTTTEGVAVTPSSGTTSGDEDLKKKIAASFSDQVQVEPDQSGTAGVIVPVFRSYEGKDFIYVMAPINGSRGP